MKNVRSNGFTLIELLVVISIIAVLMSILMPALGKVKEQAKNVLCQSNQRQLGIAIISYTHDNNDKMPLGWDTDGSYWNPTPGKNFGVMWMDALYSYVGENCEAYDCPNAKKHFLDAPYNSRWTFDADNYFEFDTFGGFGYNGWMQFLDHDIDFQDGSADMKNEFHWGKLSKVSRADTVPIFMDAMWNAGWPMQDDTASPIYGEYWWDACPQFDENMRRFCIDRHSGNVNAVMADGSTGKYELKEIWSLKWHRQYKVNWANNNITDWPDWME